jgi:dolichol-phosphate mannosyltransferase
MYGDLTSQVGSGISLVLSHFHLGVATQTKHMNSVCIIVPTYNEAENISLLLTQLAPVLDGLALVAAYVLVVDDESPDGTADIVATFQQGSQRIKLISGPKQGLGSAYTRGIDYALDELVVDAIVQMDADLSHAPADIPKLLGCLEDADVAIGSRYVAGGKIDAQWGMMRRLLSRGANIAARFVAGIYHVHDCTAGFRAIRTSALRRAWPLRFHVQGYVFQVALLHHLMISGATIVELPVYFNDRSHGSTKLGQRDILEFFIQVWWLRLLSRKTFVKFAITGLLGVVVNLTSFQAMLAFGLNSYFSSVLAIELSIVSNFFINNYWTFRHRNMSSRKRVRGLKFNLVSLMTLSVSFGSFVLLLFLFPQLPLLAAQALSIFPAALANHFANSYWTFNAGPD